MAASLWRDGIPAVVNHNDPAELRTGDLLTCISTAPATGPNRKYRVNLNGLAIIRPTGLVALLGSRYRVKGAALEPKQINRPLACGLASAGLESPGRHSVPSERCAQCFNVPG